MSHNIQGGMKLFFASLIFSYSYFWIALAVPYLSYRGLSGAQIFTLMSLYQLVGAILLDNNIQNLVILGIAIIMFVSLFFAKRYVSLKLDQK